MEQNDGMVCQLDKDEFQRYGRQMILESFGLESQLLLKRAHVVVVGAGGLGCPVIAYLASVGVGHLTIVDDDLVDRSNLHRQILHTDNAACNHDSKASSATRFVSQLNPRVEVTPLQQRFTRQNAFSLCKDCCVVVDCSDNPATRYTCSDVCHQLMIPMVSASALLFHGQLTVFDPRVDDCPCYRCLNPRPPPLEARPSCGDAGVFSPVVGTMGSLQASETIKLICNMGNVMTQRMLMLDCLRGTTRVCTLRKRSSDCVCRELREGIIEMHQVINPWDNNNDDDDAHEDHVCTRLPFDEKTDVTPKQLHQMMQSNQVVVIDVRPTIQWGICRIPNTKHIPLLQLTQETMDSLSDNGKTIVFVCRRGIDSKTAADKYPGTKNMHGGLVRWATDVDTDFPVY